MNCLEYKIFTYCKKATRDLLGGIEVSNTKYTGTIS